MNEENILMQAGLSEEQALIYQTLLDKGPQKASDLASWTGIKRGLTYKVLEQLVGSGLVQKKESTGTIALYFPGHPQLLMEFIERKEKEVALTKQTLVHSLGNFSSKFNLLTGKPNIQFFEGQESVERITTDFPQKTKEIKQIIDISSALKQFEKSTVSSKDKRVSLGISKQMLLVDTPENRDYIKKETPLTEFRFLPKHIEMPSAFQVYDEKVSILTLNDSKKIGLIIEDKDIAFSFENLFKALWDMSTSSQSKE